MTEPTTTSAMASILPGIFGLAGVVLGALLTQLREILQRRKRHLSYWSALSAEVDLCHGFAMAYENDPVQSPLYRLPTLAYEKGFPALLADGATTENEAHCILRFYGQVLQINRGLEYAHAGRNDPKTLALEESRLKLKTKNLIDPNCTDPGGPYYSAVRGAIDRRVKRRL
jgi:hypothetical protein